MQQRKIKKCRFYIYLFTMFLIISTIFLPCICFAAEDKAKTEKKEIPDWAKNLPDWIINPPEWIKNIKPSGDIRLRYQWEDRKDDDKESRDRGRFRLRFGAETKLVDEVKVGFGLASGSGDPRSYNVTFENTFEKKNIRIDYVFAEYTPAKWLRLTGGKFQNPLWRPDDLLWDTDITPEGAAMNLNTRVLPNLDLFFNSGFFILDERDNHKDPFMVPLQSGLDWKITKDINLTLALAYYLFRGVKDNTLEYSSNSNTLISGKLKYNYDAPALTGALVFKNPAGIAILPNLWLFGDYIYNPDPDEENKGYLVGLGFGHSSIKNFGDWQFIYSYRRLEKDAWPDFLPDSDFYGGATNVKGHEAILNFGLWKNIWLGFDYYRSQKILGLKQTESILQADLNLKF